jgi:hypothetical protein
MNKKAQFGPDALVGLVLVAILGLGGVFFLNTFINGLALHGIISVLDSEIDQRCFFILLPIVGDEYSRAGNNVTGVEPFNNMSAYFGGESDYSYISYEFNNTINVFRASSESRFITNLTYIDGYIATEDRAAQLRGQELDYMTKNNIKLTNYCSLPVYSPTGKIGTAELIMSATGS